MTEEERRKLEAIALAYNKGDEAPKVVATGKGYVAENIIQKALEADVPIHQDEKVANALADVEIGSYIPQELYEVVAEILMFVGDMEKIREKIK
ncbi:MAG: EscU/YscU/HrcU family type III secretion system export apparatus switch protein [Lachnospiraceae bacterium]|jgi:flagellar biosynthesis protein|nr:EscU/YscU/HrcU family type III secretion system export apparatus switch protein [Lachnospiraceae bacterium]MCR4801901.1 EscU/YscU/HrcU family type III secretion system export apparatus switch protein [Lachnospiraceae bacterium]